MKKILCFCVILVFCSPQVNARWPMNQYLTVENLLISIQGNVEKLYNYIQHEKRNQYGPNAPNGTFTGGLNMAYSSFVQDVERRLEDIENATAILSQNMKVCPDAPTPPPAPRNIRVESTTQDGYSAIVVSWDPIPNVPETLQYKVYFQPIEPDGTIKEPEVVFRLCDGTQSSASITDLTPRHHYRIKVGAVDGAVVEAQSRILTTRTPDIVPGEPTDVAGVPVGPNEIKLSWQPPVKRGEITAYVVHHYDTHILENFTYTVIPAALEYVVKDLTEGVVHEFYVSARSDNGESGKSLPTSVKTPEFMPPEVYNMNAKGLNTTAVRVEYQPPYSPVGIVRGYRIYYNDFINMREDGILDVPDPNQNVAVITGLVPNTGYYVSVVGYTRRSTNTPLNYVFARTLGAVPTTVRNVRCRTLRTDPPMIKLMWMPPKNMFSRDPPLYHIFWGVDNGVFRNETIKNMSVTWTSDYLDDDLNHTFIIAAENNEGLGGEVEVKLKTPKRIFTTPLNIKVGRLKRGNKTLLHVSWDPMTDVTGYRVLYRVFQWVYRGRWNIVEVDNPAAVSETIPIKDSSLSYIVVVRAKQDHLRRRNERRRQFGRFGRRFKRVKQIPCSVTYFPERTHRVISPEQRLQ